MENLEINEPSNVTDDIVLNQEAQFYLLKAAKWAKFLGIIGFVFCGLFLILALSMGTIFATMGRLLPGSPGTQMLTGMSGFIIAFYIVIDVFYFFFALYLFKFGNKINSAILFRDSIGLTSGLEKLKSFFKLWGISTIVFIGLYILIIVVAVIVAIMSRG